MPGMDGFETAAQVKRREKTRDIPIVFLTAIDGEAHQAFRGYAAGAVDYLAKPFDPWVLRAKVGVFIELYESAASWPRRPTACAASWPAMTQLVSSGSACEARDALEQAQALHEDGGAGLAEALEQGGGRRARAARGPARDGGSGLGR